MNVEVLENEKDKLKIKMDDLTFINLLNERVWDENIEYAAYKRDHPYMQDPVLLVRSKNPKKTLQDANSAIEKEITSLKKQVAAIKD